VKCAKRFVPLLQVVPKDSAFEEFSHNIDHNAGFRRSVPLKPASEDATDRVGHLDAWYMVIVGGPDGRLVCVPEKPRYSSPTADISPQVPLAGAS
jgi:hypothetical protein